MAAHRDRQAALTRTGGDQLGEWYLAPAVTRHAVGVQLVVVLVQAGEAL